MTILLSFLAGVVLASIGFLWLLSMCRSSGRADECAECLQRRQDIEVLRRQRPPTTEEKLGVVEFLQQQGTSE